VLDWFIQISFSSFFHFNQNHGADFFSLELLDFTLEFNGNHGFIISSSLNLERPKLDVSLDDIILKLSSN